MPVNQQDGTIAAGDELLEALDNSEQELTEEAGVEDEEAPETDELDADDGDEEDGEDEAESDEDEDEGDEGTKRYTVKLNGEEARVSLEELKAGYMKDADYRRKTSDLSADRKRVEGLGGQYETGLKTLGDQLEVVAAFMANQINIDEKELDELAEKDPAQLVRVQRELGKKGSVLQNAHNHLQAVRAAQAQEAQRKTQEFRDAEAAKLGEVDPTFRNPETVERLHTYLKKTFGLSKDEIESVADHRFALIAEKARRYDAIKGKAALKDKQVKKVPAKFQKGGASQRVNDKAKSGQANLKRVMSSGKIDDLASMF